MLKSLLRQFGRIAHVDIPEPVWQASLATLPGRARLAPADLERLRKLSGALLAQKAMAGAGGLLLDGTIQTAIAAQACLPILNLGLHWYRGWSQIVVYPAEFRVPRRITDEDGVVHEYVDTVAGESWQRGPLILSWADVQPAPATPAAAASARGPGQASDGGAGNAYNVVIHEFAHKLDQLDGAADGMPPFDRNLHRTLDRRRWMRDLDDAFERFGAELELIDASLPRDLDPESPAADRHYLRLPLDPYAAHDPGEFFAVSSEAFFIAPAALRDAFPAWYGQLAAFYRQDPLD
jgi:Mlc titration factor MtfA (ptsG expression regulator)